MKKTIFIGSRVNVLKEIKNFSDLELIGLFVLEDSVLHQNMKKISFPDNVNVRMFGMKEKDEVFEEITKLDFDIIISNGCPFIFPLSEMQKEKQLFINIHPTLLPFLKGKTPLNGVFMTHQKSIGATMHYINDGIDTGNIIAQQKIDLTEDIDQGLVYKISFDLEGSTFVEGMQRLIDSNFAFEGTQQSSRGSYFNRTQELQTIDINKHQTEVIIDKIKSFGIKSQGSFMKIKNVTYKIYSAEKIINNYLLSAHTNVNPGEVILKYEDKIIIKTLDGMIKLIDFEITEEK